MPLPARRFTPPSAPCATVPPAKAKSPWPKCSRWNFKHLGSKEVQAKSDADWKKEISEGIGKMKAVKLASDADMANLIAYMRTLKK
jgi:hypothetical protein